jgi:hypothetical protein
LKPIDIETGRKVEEAVGMTNVWLYAVRVYYIDLGLKSVTGRDGTHYTTLEQE